MANSHTQHEEPKPLRAVERLTNLEVNETPAYEQVRRVAEEEWDASELAPALKLACGKFVEQLSDQIDPDTGRADRGTLNVLGRYERLQQSEGSFDNLSAAVLRVLLIACVRDWWENGLRQAYATRAHTQGLNASTGQALP